MARGHIAGLTLGVLLAACDADGGPYHGPTNDPSTAEDAGLAPPDDAGVATDDDAGRDAGPCEEAPLEADAALVGLGACGRLRYGAYRNRGEERADNRVPDFSHAGFGGGGVAIPEDVPTVETVSPGPGDDGARIRAAIAAAAARAPDARGFHGAVLLTRGRYELAEPLDIAVSGVVLRGEGQAADRTVLVATGQGTYDLIQVRGPAGSVDDATRTEVVSEYVGVGASQLQVADAAPFAVGDRIAVLRTPNDAWIDALAMRDQGWVASDYAVAHPRTITAIAGSLLTLDVPLMDPLARELGGGAVVKRTESGRVALVGVEDLRLETGPLESSQLAPASTAIALEDVAHVWVRRVTASGFARAAVAVRGDSEAITIEDAAHLDPPKALDLASGSFVIEGGRGVLVQRAYARGSLHAFATLGQAPGPHVFLDCVAEGSRGADGPLGPWSTGVLFDNVASTSLVVQRATGGWAGAQVMLYNSHADIVADAPAHAMNWAVGCTGQKGQGAVSEEPGMWESFGAPLAPRSLYLQQLRERLGGGAVEAVAAPAQREGRVWSDLTGWAGVGRPSLDR